ncbi:MAG TPA: hypothetical protein VK034_10885, partial [Enhygromyxa sp.]|nr:hypothetical protein [Enhygromyxa sp.]
MLRAGLLSESQVTAANEHAANRSLSHVDAILELGLADEDTLVAFLASKLMIPRVRSAVLERIGPQTLARLPPLLAWEHRCVPVSFDELGNLTVAMTDPTDQRALTAIAEQTGAYLVRAVGSAAELRRALERHYGPEVRVREQAAAERARLDVSEAARSTELALEPVRAQHPPPEIRNPAPTSPAPYMASAPYVSSQPELGRVGEEVDDVPIRNGHAPAREIGSGPLDQADVDPLVEEPAGPITDIQIGPPPSPEPADVHERPTVVETQGPAVARGPRRPRAHTPWNPPLMGVSVEPVPLSPEAFAQVLPKLEIAADRDA